MKLKRTIRYVCHNKYTLVKICVQTLVKSKSDQIQKRVYFLTRKEIELGENIWVTSGYVNIFLTLDGVRNAMHIIVLFTPHAYLKHYFISPAIQQNQLKKETTSEIRDSGWM